MKGKVTGSSHEFPYIERRYTVEMDEPIEAERQRKNIVQWKKEIQNAEKEMEDVERFIEGISDTGEEG